jgi:hypothetical protein
MGEDSADGRRIEMMLPLLIGAALGASSAAATETPKAFMERLYAGYRNESYSPFTHPGRVFAPQLLAAINEDSKLANGEVGYLDGDPVCQCQDTGGMHASVTGVTQQGPNKATVRVSLRWGNDQPRPTTTFSLVKTKAGWRIGDVSSPDEPSLLKALRDSNAKARAQLHK